MGLSGSEQCASGSFDSSKFKIDEKKLKEFMCICECFCGGWGTSTILNCSHAFTPVFWGLIESHILYIPVDVQVIKWKDEEDEMAAPSSLLCFGGLFNTGAG